MADRPDAETLNAMQRGLMILHATRRAAVLLRMIFAGWAPCLPVTDGWRVSCGRDGVHSRPGVLRQEWVRVTVGAVSGWLWAATEEVA